VAEHVETANESESAAGASGTPEPSSAAVAIALGRGAKDKVLNEKTATFLDEQTAILRLQKEHLHEQRELQLSRLRWGRFSDRMRAGLQVMTALVGVVAVGVVGAAAWEAMHSDSVVVDAFHAPPSLTAQGLDGTVVASGVLDELERLQSETRIARAKRGVKDAWSNDIRLEVPETGVSLGEVQRYLHRWLGHETHISGDLSQTAQGLALTVRGMGVPARSFSGGDLKALSSQAAEYIYGAAEPYPFTMYLISHGRSQEAIALIKAAYPTANAGERPWLLNNWGIAYGQLGRYRDALVKHQQAVRLKPDLWISWNNVVNDRWDDADEEGALRATVEFERVSHRGAGGKVPPWDYENGDILREDWAALRFAESSNALLNNGGGSGISEAGPVLALADTMLHDPRRADEDLLSATDADKDPLNAANAHFTHGWSALERGDFNRATVELEAVAAAYSDPGVASEFPGLNCWLAPAEEMAGHPDKADAAIRGGGRYVDCYRLKADLLDHRGDWPAAQKAYAEAVALAPSLPAAYYSWGWALARHGDLEGAEAKYAVANQKGPHWADPLKAWGDALMAQHRLPDAEAKYAAAAGYAPHWTAVRIAWGHALQAEGRYPEAIAQYRMVAR
jgi:tetratricopeptide (TPR) repeat protein